MTSNQEFGECLEEILREMCDRVDIDYDTVDFKKDGWYYLRSWTEIEETDFRNWMVKYLRSSPKARKEIMRVSSKRKEWIEKTANEFIWQYGWGLKDESS